MRTSTLYLKWQVGCLCLTLELASAVASELTVVVLCICSLIYVHFNVHFRYLSFVNASLLHQFSPSLTSGIERGSSSDSASRWAPISRLSLNESGIIAVFTAKVARRALTREHLVARFHM